MNSLHDLFLEELADIYHAEKQLLKALPKMASAASSAELKEAFESHLEETQEQIQRLEQVFESLSIPAKGKRCEAMEGLLEEGSHFLKEKMDESVRDAGLIAAAQKVEHYEIASYGCLCTWADLMGHTEALELLKENIAEEKTADEKLTQIAESTINVEANDGETGGMSKDEEEEKPVARSRGNRGVAAAAAEKAPRSKRRSAV